MVFGKPLAALCRFGRRISTLPNLTDSSALRAARPGAAASSTVMRAGLFPSVGLGEQRGRPVGQTAILRRPHQLFHVRPA